MTLRPHVLGALWAAGALSLPWWAGTAHAQADPTRPTFAIPMAAPQGLPQGAGNSPALGAGMGAVMRPARPAAVHVPRVSSVVVGAAAMSSAVIDDRVYRLGDKVPELGTLVAIDGSGVNLRTGSGGNRRLALWSRKTLPSAAKVAKAASAPNSSATPVEAKE
jgi:hypothetical protein